MIQSTARREAEEFARALDGTGGRAGADGADRYAELTRTVALLREHPRPVPRPEFVHDLRERLLAAAETDLVPATPVARPATVPHRARRRLATVAAAAVIVGGSAGMAAAAQGSLPGDNLYPVKRGLENIALQLNTSDSARGRDLLAQSSTRLQEAQELLSEAPSARRDALVGSALADAAANANNGADLLFTSYQRTRSTEDITDVRQFAAQQMDVLGSLAADTGAAGNKLGLVGDALAAIDQQARVLCAGCSDLPGVTLPSDMLDLSAAETTLAHLVTVPTNRAGKLEKLAKKAQTVVENQPPAQTTPPPADTTEAERTDTPAKPTKTDAGGQDTDKTLHPVRDLLHGLTDTSGSGLPGQLGTTINGLTTGVGNLLGGTLDAVGGLLGGTSGTTDANK